MKHKSTLLLALCLLAWMGTSALAEDWPQLQKDGARTGRTTDTVEPPYRARWMWFGPEGTIRNQNSEPGQSGWDDDLTTRDGYDFPTPDPVPFCISVQAQPVVSNGRIFIGDMQGNVYGIDEFDGSTLWTSSHPGGTANAAAVSGNVVVFHSLRGHIRGYDVTNGALLWDIDTEKPLTNAPCEYNGVIYTGAHNGKVYAVDAATGSILWTSQDLGAPIHGGLCTDGSSVYFGCENMKVYKVSCADGSVQATKDVRGQSFRMVWPVVYDNKVWVTTLPSRRVGSEYLMEDLMASATSIDDEQNKTLDLISGQGGWSEASEDWKHFWVLNTSDFSEPFVVPVGYTDGCGRPTSPPVVDNQGRMLKWWKTKYPKLTHYGSFGTDYSVDVSAINMSTGRREVIDNGKFSNQGGDTDNLYWLMTAGDRIFMMNDFRGLQMINMNTSDGRLVQVQEHRKDDATWAADVWYWEGEEFNDDPYPPVTDFPARPYKGRMAPIVANNRLYKSEHYCITAIEHDPSSN